MTATTPDYLTLQGVPGAFSDVTYNLSQLLVLGPSRRATAKRTVSGTIAGIIVHSPGIATENVAPLVDGASAAKLIGYAERRLAAAEARGRVSLSAAGVHTFYRILLLLVRDNGPTPQVAATSNGGAEIQWLAGGRMVSAIIEPDGEFGIYGVEDMTNDVLFDYEYDAADVPQGHELGTILRTLNEMSGSVVRRPKSWV